MPKSTHPGFRKLMLPLSSALMAWSCCMLCCISECNCKPQKSSFSLVGRQLCN